MNKNFTQIALGAALLFANVANAQINEAFDSGIPTGTCWQTPGFKTEAHKGNNTAITQGTTVATFTTPFIDFAAAGSISFKYATTSKNSTDISFTVSLIDIAGYKTLIGQRNNLAGQEFITFSGNITTAGIYRVVIEFTNTGNGNGSTYARMDDLYLSGSYSARSCSTVAPVANDDNFSSTTISAFSNNVTTNDTKPNGQALIATVSKQPVSGTLIFTTDGSFTYTPEEGFTGGPITFTYTVTDANYAPLNSNLATVTIEYAAMTILPIHFMSFSGNANANKAQLAWSVADNETGSHFEVEKSTDGKKYQSVATVMTSNNVGTEKYDFTDAAFISSGSFYRIKVINKDNSTSYSKTVYIKGATTVDNKLTLMQNPVQSALNFSFTAATDETAEVAIYNLAGVKMHSQKVNARKGTNSISLGMDSKFNKGAYILTVQSSTASRSTQLIKQ